MGGATRWEGLTAQLRCCPGTQVSPPGGSLACLQCSVGQVGEAGGPGDELGPSDCPEPLGASSQPSGWGFRYLA